MCAVQSKKNSSIRGTFACNILYNNYLSPIVPLHVCGNEDFLLPNQTLSLVDFSTHIHTPAMLQVRRLKIKTWGL